MNSSFRKIAVRAIDDERSPEDIVRADFVGNVDELHVRRDTQYDAFHDSSEWIAKAKVCRERYNHFFSVGPTVRIAAVRRFAAFSLPAGTPTPRNNATRLFR